MISRVGYLQTEMALKDLILEKQLLYNKNIYLKMI